MGIGAGYVNILMKNDFKFYGVSSSFHGCFLLSSDSNNLFTWNCKDREQNNIKLKNIPPLKNNDLICFNYFPDYEMIIYNFNNYEVKLKNIANMPYEKIQPCIVMTNQNDQITVEY